MCHQGRESEERVCVCVLGRESEERGERVCYQGKERESLIRERREERERKREKEREGEKVFSMLTVCSEHS